VLEAQKATLAQLGAVGEAVGIVVHPLCTQRCRQLAVRCCSVPVLDMTLLRALETSMR
jgi:hypothetical protein